MAKKKSPLDKIKKQLDKLEKLHEKEEEIISNITEIIDDEEMKEDYWESESYGGTDPD